MKKAVISPSLLCADLSRARDEVLAVAQAGADRLHLDIMDGHFVPNLSFGPALVAALRPVVRLPFDAHLMVSDPAAWIAPFLKAGVDSVTIHVEATDSNGLITALSRIREQGAEAGVALNPSSTAQVLEPILGFVDRILIMTVEPGFGGQGFLPEQLPKIRAIREMIDQRGLRTKLTVDGGITPETGLLACESGVDELVAGTAIFRHGPQGYGDAIERLARCGRGFSMDED
ncbi:MAG: ribulose-phosphate 3-epimerase [Alphaproteobacteria bacterium]|nr:MAG: ribulose-phosphate 3-epimerase [Alphaproteobacteria bacterium]